MPKMQPQAVSKAMADYDAEADARTLAMAHKIRNDKARHGAAKKHALAMYQATHQEPPEPGETPAQEAAESPAVEAAEMRRK